ALYLAYAAWVAWRQPQRAPAAVQGLQRPGIATVLGALLPPLALIFAVLGSILFGLATPTEAAAVGAVGAALIAWQRRTLDRACLAEVSRQTLQITAMVFAILIGASLFALVFRGFGGDDVVHSLLAGLPGGRIGALFAVMAMMFVLGFVLDFIEIVFVV